MNTNIFSQPTDQDALRLTHAIALQESGSSSGTPNYNAKGKSGEHGAYQWMPGNFESGAKQYGLDPKDMSPENQDKVAYAQIKDYKDKGFQPAEIASLWNSGSPHNWENHKGANSQGVQYDTPAYVQGVKSQYQKLTNTKTTPLSDTSNQDQSPSFSSSEPLLDEISRRKQEISGIQNSDQGLGSKILQQGGEVAGLAGSLGTRALSAITPNFLESPIAGALQGAAKGVASVPIVQKGLEKYQQFAQQHPEASANIGAVGDIASLVPEVGAFTETGSLAKGLIKGGFEKVGLASTDSAKILDLVNPNLSKKGVENAVMQGRGQKTGILGNISLKPDKKTIKAAEAVTGIVDPSKTITENINMVKNGLGQEAENLKNQILTQDHPYVFKELQSKLKAISKPISIKSDATLNKQFDLVRQAAMDLAKQNGGMVSGLLDARKAFDDLVEKEFPTLYDRSNAPMKNAILSMREGMNSFIEDNLPKGSGFRESLAKQTSMFNALDGMKTKVAAEIGTNKLERLVNKHPVIGGIIKGVGKVVGGGEIAKTMGILP